MVPGLKAPNNLKIDFAPSPRQYEVWKNLQPECPECGGRVIQVKTGIDRNGNPVYSIHLYVKNVEITIYRK